MARVQESKGGTTESEIDVEIVAVPAPDSPGQLSHAIDLILRAAARPQPKSDTPQSSDQS
jgi:hypothetical protein